MSKLFASVLLALTLAAPAAAQVSTVESANPAPKGKDPNRIVCEVFDTTGTRLGRRKVCKTAAEWTALTREHKMGLSIFQQQGTSTGCQEGMSNVFRPGSPAAMNSC
ncbi:MAG TPA: hypothetical protein VF079_04565 [Sphingomicrobium sp.]